MKDSIFYYPEIDMLNLGKVTIKNPIAILIGLPGIVVLYISAILLLPSYLIERYFTKK